MRKREKHLLITTLAVGLGGLMWLFLALGLLHLVLPEDQWAALIDAQAGRGGLIILLWFATLYPISLGLRTLIDRHLTGTDRLSEQARAVITQDHRLDPKAWEHPPHQRLAATINELVDQRQGLEQDMQQRVDELTRRSELEKSRLAALMNELDKSVVVCNLDGRILLYNPRAKLQFKRLSRAPGVTQGSDLLGLGRSIHSVIDRELIDHALNKVRRRLSRGVSNPSSQFVMGTASGALFRGLVSPVCEVDGQGQRDASQLTGFVLLLENITREIKAHQKKDQLLEQLTREGEDTLAQSRQLIDQWDGGKASTEESQALISTLGQNIDQLKDQLAQASVLNSKNTHGQWPMEDMRAEDWLEASLERLDRLESNEAAKLETSLITPDQALWLHIDSHALMKLMLSLISMLQQYVGMDSLVVNLQSHNDQALVDLIMNWPRDQALPDLGPWLDRPLSSAAAAGSALSPGSARDVLRRHTGECWIDRLGNDQAKVRILLPTIQARDEMPARVAGERPEFFDFDLFARSNEEDELAQRRLSDLNYTVFDLETTGLNPAAGDEIIQVGAVRVVNGRILAQESFDQLVDPGRSIPTLGIQIHGITPDQVRGQPSIDEVLPAFHAYAHDSVLVAHNAAFDMRCITLKQDALGIEFDHPVLDTLLLASLAQPNQTSHSLDALAERFGLVIHSRHTGLGDATVTAQLLLRLIPLLADLGIHTLAQAQAASAKSYFARVQY